MKINIKGFSIIEILIGILIFSIGLTGVYILIISTLNLNEYSKNSIIATNLAREAIENVRNVRNNNYLGFYKWNKLPGSRTDNFFSTGVYYKIENDYSSISSEFVKFDVINDFAEGKDYLSNKMQDYRLCLDEFGRYTYNCNNPNKKTHFYRYLKMDDVVYTSSGANKYITGAIKLTSKVIWYSRGYHEVELKTILTDYFRQ